MGNDEWMDTSIGQEYLDRLKEENEKLEKLLTEMRRRYIND